MQAYRIMYHDMDYGDAIENVKWFIIDVINEERKRG